MTLDAIVTGAKGFVGSALAASLKQSGQNILALSRTNGDVENPETWEKLPPARTVFHLAGPTYVPDSWKMPETFIRTHVMGTQCALDYCRAHRASLVLASAYVYGIPDRIPIAEIDPSHPNNPYALSKRLAEKLCEFAAEFQNIPVTILRIFNIYGPGQRADFLFPIILDAIQKREPIRVQTLIPKRDYVYLADVVEAFLKAQKSSGGLKTINIGSGESHSVKEVINIMQTIAGTQLPVLSAQTERPQEIPDVKADIAQARQLLDWSPRYSLQQGLTDLAAKTSI